MTKGRVYLGEKLKFREDGTFVIVQFSDVEFIDAEDLDPETPLLDSMTKSTMERVIAIERPDLVVFAGDLTASARSKDPRNRSARSLSLRKTA